MQKDGVRKRITVLRNDSSQSRLFAAACQSRFGLQIREVDGDILARLNDDPALLGLDLAVTDDFDAEVVEVGLAGLEGWRAEDARARRGLDLAAIDEQLGANGDFEADLGLADFLLRFVRRRDDF